MVGCLEKGLWRYPLYRKGKRRTYQCSQKQTPLTRLAAFMMDIENHNPFTSKMNPTVAEMFRRMAPYTEGRWEKVMKYERQLEPLLEKLSKGKSPWNDHHTTLNFTMAKGSRTD